MSIRPDIADWLGDTAADITDEQIERITDAFDVIEQRFPRPDSADSADEEADGETPDDDADTRAAALTGAVQLILGDATLEGISAELARARAAEEEQRMIQLGAVLAASTGARSGEGSMADLMERTGAARGTIRKILGKD